MSFRASLRVAPALLGVAAATLAQAPTYSDHLGRPLGDRITRHHEMVAYLEALDASDRVRLGEGGRSWEGRELLHAIVTSPANQERLDEIREAAGLLGDPRRLDPEAAAELVRTQPAIVWLGGSIHGFELSGAEGLLKLLERLATAADPDTLAVLDATVVIVDPMLNPDGRDAFALRNLRSRGRERVPDRDDWGNDFGRWEALAYRTGHYFFDTNRDWWAQTQPETRGRVPTLLAWRPQVVVDLHEMSSDVEFFFDPPTEPYGPFFPGFARRWFPRFGAAYAAAFDRAGFEYMTGERYNYLYPGYTTSFGSYQGAVGMLYEQGSSRGLSIRRADESVRTLADALEQQYTAAWTAVQTAAGRREELLGDYYAAHREGLADGARGVRRYYLALPGDPLHLEEAGELLTRCGIEVGVLSEEVELAAARGRDGQTVERVRLPPGTLVVEAAQPRNRLVRTLLEPDQPLPAVFLAEARERLDRGENPRFYDVTAWSLPLLFDLAAYGSREPERPPATPFRPGSGEASLPPPPGYAYLIDGAQTASLAAAHRLRADGVRLAVVTKATRLAGRGFAAGTVVVRIGQNDAGLEEKLRRVAARYRLAVDGVDTGRADEGFPALGSGDAVPLSPSEIALLGDDPVHAYSFGWVWHLLDRQYELPVTVRRVGSVASTPLDRFDVLVIPDLFSAEALGRELGDGGLERIRAWVRDGGTLVALGEAVELARGPLDLIDLASYYDPPGGAEGEAAEGGGAGPRRFTVPGAILRARLDPSRWLASGLREELPALVTSDRVLLPPPGPPDPGRRVVARYAAAGELLLSGHLWPESAERLPGAVLAYEQRVDRGRVIAFAEDLSFRGTWRGAHRLLLNAVVLGPSAP